MQRLEKIGIYWNTRKETLEFGYLIQSLCKIVPIYRIYFIEVNRPTTSIEEFRTFAVKKSKQIPISKTIYKIQYRRYSYISQKAINHFEEVFDGIEILDSPKINITEDSGIKIPCEICSLIYTPRQISRIPLKKVLKPFEKIHFDLIQINKNYNRDL